jgi:hypothetical protein
MENLKAFSTDGCSGGLSWIANKVFGKELPWRGACVEHDVEYWIGGTKRDRKLADIELLTNVADNGYPIIGFLMYIAVRIGGSPYYPTKFRWGYGSNFPDKYKQRNNEMNSCLIKEKIKKSNNITTENSE